MTLETFVYLAGYCVLGIAVAALVAVFIKTFWVFLVVSATASSMLLQLIAFIYLGFVDTWAYIAFPPSWFIGLGCAITYHVIATGVRKARSASGER